MTKKYNAQALFDEATKSDAYWIEKALLEFTEDVIGRMEQLNMSRSELASKIDASPAYVTKILRGSTNFTLQSMVRIGRAIGCELRTHLQPEGMQSRWFDLLVSKPVTTRIRTSNELKNLRSQYSTACCAANEEYSDDTFALAS
ncbi:MAG: helix-turn-helix transcriptional regulator [Planctomycetes bacterium]|nr:helix-turn-helix transcriptional regulator [Planctomycetota bacterium]